MAAEAEALAAGYVVDTPRPADRDGWGEMWAGYCAFYAVADAAGKAEVVWHWLLDPAHPVKGFVARDPQGKVVGLTHYRPFHRPSPPASAASSTTSSSRRRRAAAASRRR